MREEEAEKMTNVYAEHDGNRYLIDADGHAGDAEACNYINGALYSFAGYAHNAAAEERATILAFSTEDGHMTIHCIGDERVGAAFDAAIIGILQLAQVRPKAVSVELHEGT